MEIAGTHAPGAAGTEGGRVVGTVDRAHKSGQAEEVPKADFEGVVLELVAIAACLIPDELDTRAPDHGIQQELERRQVVGVVATGQVAPVDQPDSRAGNDDVRAMQISMDQASADAEGSGVRLEVSGHLAKMPA